MNENKLPKILSFIDWYKPAFKAGGPIRSMVNLTELLKESSNFFVVCGNKEIDGTLLDVNSNQWIEQATKEKVYYCSKPRKSLISKWIKENPNGVFHINGIYSFKFSILPLIILKIYFHQKKVVVSPRGMMNDGALKIKSVKKQAFISFARGLGLFDNVVWHATSQEEESRIRRFFPKSKKINILSNVPIAPKRFDNQIQKTKGILKLYSVTRVVPIKKLEVILQALINFPIDSEIIFDIYGPIEDKEYADGLSNLSQKISNLVFNFKGAVSPEELSLINSQYHLFCLPSSNENFGHSIYEALANACPVLISDKTPWKNLAKEKAGFDIELNNLKDFSEKLYLFSQMVHEEWEQWSNGAFSFAEKNYNKDEWIKLYLSLFESNAK